MRAVVTRVLRAAVEVGDQQVGAIDRPGLLVLLGITHHDELATATIMARKLFDLRVLRGELCCAETGAPLLVVSQFTLYGDTRRGRRPSWSAAAPALVAEPLVTAVIEQLRGLGADVATGVFGAAMTVTSTNDGPFTVIVDL